MREHSLATLLLMFGLTFRSYSYLTSTVALLVSMYALVVAQRALTEARHEAVKVVKGEVPPERT